MKKANITQFSLGCRIFGVLFCSGIIFSLSLPIAMAEDVFNEQGLAEFRVHEQKLKDLEKEKILQQKAKSKYEVLSEFFGDAHQNVIRLEAHLQTLEMGTPAYQSLERTAIDYRKKEAELKAVQAEYLERTQRVSELTAPLIPGQAAHVALKVKLVNNSVACDGFWNDEKPWTTEWVQKCETLVANWCDHKSKIDDANFKDRCENFKSSIPLARFQTLTMEKKAAVSSDSCDRMTVISGNGDRGALTQQLKILQVEYNQLIACRDKGRQCADGNTGLEYRNSLQPRIVELSKQEIPAVVAKIQSKNREYQAHAGICSQRLSDHTLKNIPVGNFLEKEAHQDAAAAAATIE
ncbi:hypothetical protein WDW37_01795 [Bdellovibrionota bacterium FG-1]